VDPQLSTHAHVRMRQRGIRPEALERLLEFGREAFDHRRHSVVVYFDKKARKQFARKFPHNKDAEQLVRCYAVLGKHGEVVTVGYRYRRIARP
jgi:hypothetical protein